MLAENALLDRDLITLPGTENVILLNLTCEFFIEIKKLAIVEEVLGYGWVDCDSLRRSQSLHQLVKRVQIHLLIHYLQRVKEAVGRILCVADNKEDKVNLQEIPQLGYPCC
jgi:hypothetical protein